MSTLKSNNKSTKGHGQGKGCNTDAREHRGTVHEPWFRGRKVLEIKVVKA